jgi:hypothetical protein
MSIARLSTRATGVAVICVAAWGGIVAYVGPTFHFATRGSYSAWMWNPGHTTLSLAPAIGGIVGGILLLGVGGRALERVGAVIALLSGVWFIIGPSLEPLWINASSGLAAVGTSGSATVKALESVGYYYGPGAALVLLGSLALGLISLAPAPAGAPSPAPEPAAVTTRHRFQRPSHAA